MKKFLSVVLAALVLLGALSTAAAADGPCVAEVYSGLHEEQSATPYQTLDEAFLAASKMSCGELPVVRLLRDAESGDISISDLVIFDLNHFTLSLTGSIVNNGSILLHTENTGMIRDLVSTVAGTYSAGEELTIGTDGGEVIIPEGAFFTSDVFSGAAPGCELSFAIFEDSSPLIWNAPVPAGTQIEVTNAMALGGDLLSSADLADTKVTATYLSLSRDIAVGGSGSGSATLFVESFTSELDGEHTTGIFNPNGHTVTIYDNGEVVVSADVFVLPCTFRSGVAGKTVVRTFDRENCTYTYRIASTGEAIASAVKTVMNTVKQLVDVLRSVIIGNKIADIMKANFIVREVITILK